MSSLVGYVNLAASNLDTFTNANDNDLMIYTMSNTQQILIGVQSNVRASITVNSNLISFNNNISFGNTIAMKGLQIGMSDGTMANLSTSSVQGLSNESTGNLQLFVNSNTLSNNFRFQASNVEVARLTGTGNLGLGTSSNIAATVHAFGPNPVNSNNPVNTSNLLTWYQFEGNGLDSSGNGYHLTQSGSNLVYIPGQYGDALWLNNPTSGGGSGNTYFTNSTVGNSVGIAPPVTYTFWINVAKAVTGSWQPTVFLIGGANNGFFVNINSGNLLIAGITTVNTAIQSVIGGGSGVTLTTGVWYHFAATYNGTTCTTYLNGVSVGTPVSATGNIRSGGLAIGDSGGSTTYGWAGAIDDVRIYSRILSVAEINTLYTATASNLPSFVTPTSGLVGWYPLEGNGNDSSGNNYNAVAVGTPFFVPGKVGNAAFFPNPAGSTQNHSFDAYGYAGQTYQAPVSVAFWANLATIGTENTFLNIGASNSDQGLFINYTSAAGLNLYIHNGSYIQAITGLPLWNARTWYHVVTTYTSGSAAFYLNGQLVKTSTAVTGNLTNASALRIGGRFGQNLALCGSMDDVRIYNRVISAGEVTDLYNMTYTGAGNGNSLITTGSVGVGMVPSYPLDVVGSIRASQDIISYGNISAGNLGMFRNRIINGNVVFDQRGSATTAVTVTSGVGTVYSADRWFAWSSRYTTYGLTAQQVTDAPTGVGLKYSIKYTATAAISGGTNAYIIAGQIIEGYNIADFMWGTSQAVPCTLSFWVKATRAGTFTLCLETSGEASQYLTTYTVTVANTWQYIVLVIPPNTSDASNTTNGVGMYVHLLTQGTYASVNSGWRYNTGTYSYTVTGATSALQSSSDSIQFTGVQLEKGSIATPFEFRPYALELQLCQRYCMAWSSGYIGTVFGNGASSYAPAKSITMISLQVPMRSTPNIVVGSLGYDWSSYGAGALGNLIFFYATPTMVSLASTTSIQQGYTSAALISSSVFYVSAEL
jgi:hypothetical protein